ncbi:jerky-like protein [Trichonephila clavipes]|nr:jerky-like protein [Trichonephila clavipes]
MNSSYKFKETFMESVEEEEYSRDDNNVDETEVNWKALPRRSFASKRESTAPSFKVSKERGTAMVCVNASETDSLSLLVIGKSKNPHCFKNVSCLPTFYKRGVSSTKRHCDDGTNESRHQWKSQDNLLELSFAEITFGRKRRRKCGFFCCKAQYEGRLFNVSRSVGLTRKTEPEKDMG